MQDTNIRFKVKLYGDDPEELDAAVELIIRKFKTVTTSPLLRSQPRGYHMFLTVWRPQEEKEAWR